MVWWIFYREKIGISAPNILMKKYLKTPFLLSSIWIVRGLLLISLLTLFIDPHTNREVTLPSKNTWDIVIVLDISRSMLTDDISPNRLEKAKELIGKFLEKRKSVRIGYVVFAGKPFILSPLTDDISGLSRIVESTFASTIQEGLRDTSGTNIGDAILSASRILSARSWSGEKSIVLITDGRANLGIDPRTAAKESKEKNIRIYAIGVGESSGSLLSYKNSAGAREYFYDELWNRLKADIDETTLQEIARQTEGRYFHASDTDILEDVFISLDSLLSSASPLEKGNRSTSLTPIILIIIIIWALIHEWLWFLVRKKYKVT